MINIRIVDDTYSEITRPCDPEDRWDNDDTSTDHNIKGYEIVEGYYDVTTNMKLKPGKMYALIYVIYSTGDSFSHHEGEIEYIGLYDPIKHDDIIRQNVERIRNHPDRKYSINLLSEKGEEYKMSAPWVGYFENLTSVEVKLISQVY